MSSLPRQANLPRLRTTDRLGPISKFIERHYRHFNAAALIDAAHAYSQPSRRGRQMMLALAGAMSTAELGVSLAEMIRQGKVHAICCTGANLEEDVFNLVAHVHYERVPHYRDLTPQDEQALLERHLNRVTDTCIPEDEAMRRIENIVLEEWRAADRRASASSRTSSSIECCCSGKLERALSRSIRTTAGCSRRRREPADLRPGLGGLDARQHLRRALHPGHVKNVHTVRSGIEYMMTLAEWYRSARAPSSSIGFFQIGGGIAGDFPICVVPMLSQDLRSRTCRSGATSARSATRRRAMVVLGRGPEREDHLGQARHRHAEVHHRVRRDDRRAAHLRPRPELVVADTKDADPREHGVRIRPSW